MWQTWQALLEHLGLTPAWVAGNSFGASITLRLASQHRTLLRGVIAHEPPLFGLLADDPVVAPLLQDVRRRIAAVVERIASGDHAGPPNSLSRPSRSAPVRGRGSRATLQQTLIDNAPTFLDEARDPRQLAYDLGWLRGFAKPALLTLGDQSPPTFAPVIARLAKALPHAEVVTLEGAGHIPHVTHPEAYVDAIMRFTHKQSASTRISA